MTSPRSEGDPLTREVAYRVCRFANGGYCHCASRKEKPGTLQGVTICTTVIAVAQTILRIADKAADAVIAETGGQGDRPGDKAAVFSAGLSSPSMSPKRARKPNKTNARRTPAAE